MQIIVGLLGLIMTILGSLVGYIFYGHIHLEADHQTTKVLVMDELEDHDGQLKDLWRMKNEEIAEDKIFTKIYWSAHPDNRCVQQCDN